MPYPFTPEEITEILDQYFSTILRRQYVGARYVPIFGRKDEDSIEWDNTGTYEPLTVVLYQGNSYTSRQYVPVGVEITNLAYWANTGNYNAQVEQYRQEVYSFDDRITANTNAIEDLEDIIPSTDFSDTNTVKAYIDSEIGDVSNDVSSLEDIIPSSSFSSSNTVKAYIDNEINGVTSDIQSLGNILPASSFSDASTVKSYIDNSITSLSDILPASSFSSVNTIKKYIDDKATNRKIMVVIGDSFSYSVGGYTGTPYWHTYAAKALGCEVKNFAYGSCGYTIAVQGGKTFVDQIQAANDDTSFNNFDVAYVVIYGGVNDGNSLSANVVKQAYDKATSYFTNATIAVIFNADARGDTNAMTRRTVLQNLLQQGVNANSTTVIQYANVNTGGSGGTDYLHPSVTGSRSIGMFIADILGMRSLQHLYPNTDTTRIINNLTLNNTDFSFNTAYTKLLVIGDEISLKVAITNNSGSSFTGDVQVNFANCVPHGMSGNDTAQRVPIYGLVPTNTQIEVFGSALWSLESTGLRCTVHCESLRNGITIGLPIFRGKLC